MKFKPANTEVGGGTPTGAPHTVDILPQEIADLRRKLDAQMAAKSKSKSTRTNYLKGNLTAGVIAEFLQEPGIPEWMEDVCALLTTALEEELLEDPSVPAQDPWKLVINKYKEYGKRYRKGRGSGRGRSSSRPKSRRNRSSSSARRGKKSQRSRRSRSSSTESSFGDSSGSKDETYYRGKFKFKFTVRDGIEYLITNNGREGHTDKRPPGDCDKCGGRH